VEYARGSRPVRGAIVPRRELFERLAGAGRVTVVAAPAGSGKTSLLRSWIAEAGIAERVGWVPVQREEHDPQRFWISVLDALRDASPGSAAVRPLTPTPDLDGGAILERLLEDVGSLEDPLWLVIDDLQELRSAEALHQLALLLLRASPQLRFVLSTRCDLHLGLHRLRLESGLTEIRADELRFSLDQARALFQAAGVKLSAGALARLHERTEGWCAGLKLAVLSLAGNRDPERFAAEFGGSERTVAEYLMAEVLERQPEEFRRLLLRTSMLDRVNGPLADLLTGRSGGELVLQELEEAGAFVVSLDARRTWFRYHQLFADLLQRELGRTAPAQLAALHDAAAGWFTEHGYPVEAIRHAQAAGNWSLATHLLSEHWLTLRMAGQGTTADALLAGFPGDVVAADAELPALVAAGELMRGSPAEGERQLALTTRGSASVPGERRLRVQALLAVQRLGVARRRTDLPAAAEEVRRLLIPPEARESAPPGIGDELRAVALAYLGIAELWSGRLTDAQQHLEQARALAQRAERPDVEVGCVAYGAVPLMFRSFRLARDASMQAIELAHEHGLGEAPEAGIAYTVLVDALRESSELREAIAALRLAQEDPEVAVAELAPVLDGSVGVLHPAWLVEALVLEAIARDALGDAGAAGQALERALDLAEPDGLLWPFLCHPAPALLERHARHRTMHTSLVCEIRGLLAGARPVSPRGEPDPLLEPLSESETRVLRYLPTNLSGPEIAGELYVAVSTVKTHIHHIYGKLGVHRRAEAVERARAAGLLAPSSFKSA
jgi:LuxR family maltose regulon positive regulatory protein